MASFYLKFMIIGVSLIMKKLASHFLMEIFIAILPIVSLFVLCEYALMLVTSIIGKLNFSDQFKKIIKRYKRVGYSMDIMRQSTSLVVNPITVDSYGFLFYRTTVG